MSTRGLGFVLAAVASCSAVSVSAQQLPEGNGKAIVVANCNSCHPFHARLGSGCIQGWVGGWLYPGSGSGTAEKGLYVVYAL